MNIMQLYAIMLGCMLLVFIGFFWFLKGEGKLRQKILDKISNLEKAEPVGELGSVNEGSIAFKARTSIVGEHGETLLEDVELVVGGRNVTESHKHILDLINEWLGLRNYLQKEKQEKKEKSI